MKRKKGMIIALVGASGVGKTFLTQKLASRLGGTAFIEPGWREMPRALQLSLTTQKKLLRLHVWFLKKSLKNSITARVIKKRGGIAVLDTFFLTNQFYADVFLKGDEQKLMKKLISVMDRVIPLPNIILLLKTQRDFLKKNIQKRGRVYEKNEKNQRGNTEVTKKIHAYFYKHNKNVIIIKRDGLDFCKTSDLRKVIKKLHIKR